MSLRATHTEPMVSSGAVNIVLVSVCVAPSHLTALNKTLINTRSLNAPDGMVGVRVCVCVHSPQTGSFITSIIIEQSPALTLSQQDCVLLHESSQTLFRCLPYLILSPSVLNALLGTAGLYILSCLSLVNAVALDSIVGS